MSSYSMEQKMALIADILDREVDELNPDMSLSNLEWDSVVSLSYIAMMDEEFGKEVNGAQIKAFQTLQDALDLMGD